MSTATSTTARQRSPSGRARLSHPPGAPSALRLRVWITQGGPCAPRRKRGDASRTASPASWHRISPQKRGKEEPHERPKEHQNKRQAYREGGGLRRVPRQTGRQGRPRGARRTAARARQAAWRGGRDVPFGGAVSLSGDVATSPGRLLPG